jgi:hypothetical protein
MKKIKLTQGMYAMVDDEDFDNLNSHKWSARKDHDRDCFYAVCQAKQIKKNRKTLLMHRLILKTPSKIQVDHIDGNGLNNQKSNIRNCNRSQNQMNRINQANNTSGYKGVTWNSHVGSWQAQLKVGGKQLYLGCHKNILNAAVAYNDAAIKHFGEFARLNIIHSIISGEEA